MSTARSFSVRAVLKKIHTAFGTEKDGENTLLSLLFSKE